MCGYESNQAANWTIDWVFSIKATNSTTILRIMRTVNLLLATATIVVGVLAWIMGYVSSFQKVIAGIYIMYVAASSLGAHVFLSVYR